MYHGNYKRGQAFTGGKKPTSGGVFVIICDISGEISITFIQQEKDEGTNKQFHINSTADNADEHLKVVDWALKGHELGPDQPTTMTIKSVLANQKYKISTLACVYHGILASLHEGYLFDNISEIFKERVESNFYGKPYFHRIMQVETTLGILLRTPEQIDKSYAKNQALMLATIGSFPFCCLTKDPNKICQKKIFYPLVPLDTPSTGKYYPTDPYFPPMYPLRPDPVFTKDQPYFMENVKPPPKTCEWIKNPTSKDEDKKLGIVNGFRDDLSFNPTISLLELEDDLLSPPLITEIYPKPFRPTHPPRCCTGSTLETTNHFKDIKPFNNKPPLRIKNPFSPEQNPPSPFKPICTSPTSPTDETKTDNPPTLGTRLSSPYETQDTNINGTKENRFRDSPCIGGARPKNCQNSGNHEYKGDNRQSQPTCNLNEDNTREPKRSDRSEYWQHRDLDQGGPEYWKEPDLKIHPSTLRGGKESIVSSISFGGSKYTIVAIELDDQQGKGKKQCEDKMEKGKKKNGKQTETLTWEKSTTPQQRVLKKMCKSLSPPKTKTKKEKK